MRADAITRQAKSSSAELVRGAIDLHMHTAPDIYPRSVTTYEAAVQARAAGMRAIVVKSHSTDTAARAELVRDLTGLPVFGGIALNYPVGGLNPHAVLETVRQGGREVWMPTTSARHFLSHAANAPILREKAPLDTPGLVASEQGRLLPEVEEILDLVAEHGLILSSGHLEPSETLLLFREARERGVERLVVTHPHAEFVGMSVEQMREAGELGALNEMHYAFTTPAIQPPQKLGDIVATIRAVGIEHCILATDGGQSINPPPVEMLRLFIDGLVELGFTRDEIVYMTAEAPGELLALETAEAGARNPS